MILIMDEGEILREYRAAKKKKTEQVRILAELNCCSKKEMATWLRDHGETVDKRYFRDQPVRKPKQKEEREEKTVTEVTEAPHRAGTEAGSLTAPREVLEIKPSQTAKADAGKPRLTLVPMQIMFDVTEVREYGCRKYPNGGVDNWKKVEPQRYREAAFRHFLRYLDDPHGKDEESGIEHFKHLECNIAFLAEMEKEQWS